MMLLSVVAENYGPLLLLADPCCLSKSIKNDVLTNVDFSLQALTENFFPYLILGVWLSREQVREVFRV